MSVDTTDVPDDLEGELGTVTDEEWRAAHDRLAADLAEAEPPEIADYLADQMRYEWSPDGNPG